MRADRLLSMMLLLQAQGQMTAQQLADHLDVSERTIYRDIEALSYAGIPIYAQGGRNGGIALEENYRISLTGLNRSEVQSLFVSGSVAPLGDLGLESANESTLLKLLSALPSLQRAEAERIRQRIYIDPHGWFGESQVSPFLPMIQEAVLSNRILNIRYHRTNHDAFDRQIEAYGMVAKQNVWYLVGAHEGKFRNYRASRLLDVQLTDRIFERDPAFNLIDYWQESAQAFVESIPEITVTIEIDESLRPIIEMHPLMSIDELDDAEANGWHRLTLRFDKLEQARMMLMGMARDIRVIDPPELHKMLSEYTQEALENLKNNHKATKNTKKSRN